MAAKKKKKATKKKATKKKATKKKAKKKGTKKKPALKKGAPIRASDLKVELDVGEKLADGSGRIYTVWVRGEGGTQGGRISVGNIVAKTKSDAIKKAKRIAKKELFG